MDSLFCFVRRQVAVLCLLTTALLCCSPPRLMAIREIADEIVFGHFGTGIGEFDYPACITIDPRGNIIVSDHNNNSVSIYDMEGMYLGPVNPEGTDFRGPVGLCVDPCGCLFVVEHQAHQVRKFNQAGKQILVFGKRGRRKGQLRDPRGIAADAEGNVYVCDYSNRRIQQFDGEGRYISTITWVDPTYNKAARPRGVAFDHRGRLWAVYSRNHKVVRFNSFGEAELIIGSEGENLGQFELPRYIAFDVRDNAYITDHKNHRVQKFSPEGKFLYSYGFQGRGKGQLHFPDGIAVNDDGDIIIADANNHRVQIFKVKKIIRYSNRGFLHLQHEDWEKAIEWYNKVLEIDPANREALDALEHCCTTLGEAYYARGQLFKARRYYQAITRFHPSNVTVRRRIRSIIWQQNKGKVYYLVLGFGIFLTMIFLIITMVRIIRSE